MDARRMRMGVAAAAVCACAVLAAGCPEIEIDGAELTASATAPAAFTLAAAVVVTEEDPAVDDNGDLAGGRGLLGVWLPPGWSVDAARAQGPDADGFVALAPVPDGDGHFAPPFPWVAGAWSAFASPCANVDAGTYEYTVEIDVSGPEGATAVTMGLATALYDENGSNGARPTEIAVDLAAGTSEVRAAPPAPEPAGLEECPAIPYEAAAAEAGDCGCAAPGAARVGAKPLLSALL